jgi:predicted nuclease of predicted toxin-antitoxin system
MRILLDECLPYKLKHYLDSYEVQTVPEVGWAGKKNGELLRLMVEHYDVFITLDHGLPHQQSVDQVKIAVVVLVANNSKLTTLALLMPTVRERLLTLRSGEVVKVSGLLEP